MIPQVRLGSIKFLSLFEEKEFHGVVKDAFDEFESKFD